MVGSCRVRRATRVGLNLVWIWTRFGEAIFGTLLHSARPLRLAGLLLPTHLSLYQYVSASGVAWLRLSL